MTNRGENASRWLYRGAWAVLVRWFRVPQEPPTLPAAPGEVLRTFRPAPGFLSFLKFEFWVLFAIIDLAILVAEVVVLISSPVLGAVLFVPTLALAILPAVIAYIALHLRYDTTWYVLSSRSLRIRRGIWVIHETTITFENVQNITGPVMSRWTQGCPSCPSVCPFSARRR